MVNRSNKKMRLSPWLIGCVLSALILAACGGDETINSSTSDDDNTTTSVDEELPTDAAGSDDSTTTQSNTTQSSVTLPADTETTASNGDDTMADTDSGSDQNDDVQAGDDSDSSGGDETAGSSGSDDDSTDTAPDDALSEIELIATMAALGIDPDSEAAQCMRDNKDLIAADGGNSGDSIYVGAKCAPAEIGAIVAQTQTLGDLTAEETECVMIEALTYMASLPETEARAAFAASQIPEEYASEIIPIAEEKCGVSAERFAEDFTP